MYIHNICIAHFFNTVCGFSFHSQYDIFDEQKFLTLMKPNLSGVFGVCVCVCVCVCVFMASALCSLERFCSQSSFCQEILSFSLRSVI